MFLEWSSRSRQDVFAFVLGGLIIEPHVETGFGTMIHVRRTVLYYNPERKMILTEQTDFRKENYLQWSIGHKPAINLKHQQVTKSKLNKNPKSILGDLILIWDYALYLFPKRIISIQASS